MKMLIIKPSSLGDVIHSLPFLSSMRQCFPDAEIHWVIARGLEDLLEGHPMLNKLWTINKEHWKSIRNIKDTISEIKSLSNALRAEHYDFVVDLQGLFRSGLIAFMTNAPMRIGFKEAREGSVFFYTHKVEGGREMHAVDRHLKIASAIGCNIDEISFPMPIVMESDKVQKLKKEMGEYAVIVPGARKPANRWHAQRFGELSSMVSIKTLIVGSKNDAQIADEVVRASNNKAISIAGQTDLRELISIIRGARAVVSNDSGPLHIAAALGIPVFAIFGPASPIRTGPYGWQTNKRMKVIKSDISCSPCFKRSCKAPLCMSDISAEMVFEDLREYL